MTSMTSFRRAARRISSSDPCSCAYRLEQLYSEEGDGGRWRERREGKGGEGLKVRRGKLKGKKREEGDKWKGEGEGMFIMK